MPTPQRRGRLVSPEEWERQNEEEAEARVQRFVDAATGGAFVHDGDEVIDVTQADEALLRYQLRRNG